MQAVKRCVRCNTVNDPLQIYCIKCGKFLSTKAESKPNRTIWDNDPAVADKKNIQINRQKNDDKSKEYIVICPQCGAASDVINGTIPLSCNQCGYFFQAGIDKVVSKASMHSTPAPASKGTVTQEPLVNNRNDHLKRSDDIRTKSPLARAVKDCSSMRLINISQNGVIPERVSEHGEIIGVNGTVLRSINTKIQISIWHSATGWYVRVMAGSPLYNGVPLNIGMQIKLNDGDMLTIDREQVRVEIV